MEWWSQGPLVGLKGRCGDFHEHWKEGKNEKCIVKYCQLPFWASVLGYQKRLAGECPSAPTVSSPVGISLNFIRLLEWFQKYFESQWVWGKLFGPFKIYPFSLSLTIVNRWNCTVLGTQEVWRTLILIVQRVSPGSCMYVSFVLKLISIFLADPRLRFTYRACETHMETG